MSTNHEIEQALKMRCAVEIEGVVHNGVIVPDEEGTRVGITPAPLETPRPFGERFAQFKGCVPGLPADLAEQHDYFRMRAQP